MKKIRKILSGTAIALAISTAITIGAFNKSFASTHWCVDGMECTTAWINGDDYYEWIEISGWCSSGGDYGSGIYFGCVCANQFGAVSTPMCSVM